MFLMLGKQQLGAGTHIYDSSREVWTRLFSATLAPLYEFAIDYNKNVNVLDVVARFLRIHIHIIAKQNQFHK